MKTKIIASLLMVSAIVPAKAQVFGPNGTAGAIVGGIVGAVIGNNSGHNAWQGAAIGAGVGLVAGTIADSNNSRTVVVSSNRYDYVAYEQPTVVYTQPQVVYVQPRVVYTEPYVVYTQPRPAINHHAVPQRVWVDNNPRVIHYNDRCDNRQRYYAPPPPSQPRNVPNQYRSNNNPRH